MGKTISKNFDPVASPAPDPQSVGYNYQDDPGLMPNKSIPETAGERASNTTEPETNSASYPKRSGNAFSSK